MGFEEERLRRIIKSDGVRYVTSTRLREIFHIHRTNALIITNALRLTFAMLQAPTRCVDLHEDTERLLQAVSQPPPVHRITMLVADNMAVHVQRGYTSDSRRIHACTTKSRTVVDLNTRSSEVEVGVGKPQNRIALMPQGRPLGHSQWSRLSGLARHVYLRILIPNPIQFGLALGGTK